MSENSATWANCKLLLPLPLPPRLPPRQSTFVTMKLNNKKAKIHDKLLPTARRILPSRAHRAAVSHLPTRPMPLALVHPAFRRFFSRLIMCCFCYLLTYSHFYLHSKTANSLYAIYKSRRIDVKIFADKSALSLCKCFQFVSYKQNNVKLWQ